MANDTLVLHETDNGRLTHGGNAVINDSKIPDPAEYRGGAPPEQRSLVKISGDVVEGNDREEVVLVQLKQSGDNVPDGRRGGEFYLGCKKPGEGSTDAAMRDVMLAFHDHVDFKVPISAPNLTGGALESSAIQSPSGRYRLQCQDDAHLVLYDMSRTPPQPIWSHRFGIIRAIAQTSRKRKTPTRKKAKPTAPRKSGRTGRKSGKKR